MLKFTQWFLPFIQRERGRLCRKGLSASVSAPTTIQRVLPSFFSPSDDLTQDHDQLRLHQLTTRSRSIHPTELRFRIYEASRTLLLPQPSPCLPSLAPCSARRPYVSPPDDSRAPLPRRLPITLRRLLRVLSRLLPELKKVYHASHLPPVLLSLVTQRAWLALWARLADERARSSALSSVRGSPFEAQSWTAAY